jgi:outer membrane protein TolC
MKTTRVPTGRRPTAGVGGIALALAILGGAAGAQGAPLSLQEAIDLARKNNPGLASARQNVRSAEGNLLSSYSAFLPSAGIDGGLSQSESAEIVDPNTGLVYQPFSEYVTSGAGVSQNLVNVPAWYQYRASKNDLAAARHDFRGSDGDLVLAVRQQYFLLLRSVLLERVAIEAFSVSEEQLRKAETLFELGSVARTDVLQARVNRATADQDRITARNAVAQERARLAVLLGQSASDSLAIDTEFADPPETVLDEAALMNEARSNRPEMGSAEASLLAAGNRRRSAFWSQFPTLRGSLFYNRRVDTDDGRGTALADAFELGNFKANASWGWAISMNWDVFDGMNTIGRIKSTRAAEASSREQRRSQELASGLAVREAEVAIRNAREGMRAAQEAVSLADESLKLQQALYENGGGTILELNTAQVERTRARNSLVDQRIGLHLALAQLDRALGR